jgi:hypothetical protein
MRQVGGSLGIAILGAIVGSGTSTSLRLGNPAEIAYLHGFHNALRVAALLAFAGAIVALAAIRKMPEHPEPPATEPAPSADAAA